VRPPPIEFAAFMHDPAARRRYWARSLVGWPRFHQARPNPAHRALAALEAAGHVSLLVTQNVDGLHQAAGSRHVVDLHGRLDAVRCMACDWRNTREAFQQQLAERNPGWTGLTAGGAPDGDADLEGVDFTRFAVPPCPACGGIVKPDVVFFGEPVPSQRITAAREALAASDALLVVGSSLMVYSGYRFARQAATASQPIAAVGLGHTRADDLLTLKIDAPCETALGFLLEG